MTLLVALKGVDGLVLAADSRGTFGDPRGITAQNDTMIKAHVVAQHTGVLIAGSSEVGALLIKEFSEGVAKEIVDHPSVVVEALRSHTRQRYTEWFPSLPPVASVAAIQTGQPMRPDLTYLIGGVDTTDGEVLIYQLTSTNDFAPMLHNYGFAVAGVPQYALYLLNRMYQPDRSIDELVSLAVYVITETASQDGKVGGPVSVITVTKDDGCSELDAQSVARVVDENETRSQNLRQSFYHPAEERDGDQDA